MANNSTKAKAEKAALKADLEHQLEAAKKAQSEKLGQSKEHLMNQLKVASEKYRTVNGYMQARSTLEQAVFGSQEGADDFDDIAREVAEEMAGTASVLASKLDKADVMTLDETFLDGLLDAKFIETRKTVSYTVMQLLLVSMLQNIGPSIDDIVSFREGTNESITRLADELAALDAKKPKLKSV